MNVKFGKSVLRQARLAAIETIGRLAVAEGAAHVLVAGDFNDWGTGLGRRMAAAGFAEWRAQPTPTYPSRLPLNQLDHVYARGLQPVQAMVPSGRVWPRMSDHLPLLAEFAWGG